MNYATLVSTVKSYLENTFPETPSSGGLTSTQQLDTFIKQAEQRIYNSAQFPETRKASTGSCTTGNRYLDVPTDFKAPYSLAVINSVTGAYTALLNKDVEFIRESFPIPSATGTPGYYAIFDGNSLVLGPTPDANYSVEMHYFYYPTSIVTAGTTWLGDNFDQVLLYGTLLEAAAFMQIGAGPEDAGHLATLKERYSDALSQLKQLGEGKMRQDTYRKAQTRYPVT